jgi:hypothetical protein
MAGRIAVRVQMFRFHSEPMIRFLSRRRYIQGERNH